MKDEGITEINRKSDTFRVFRENFIKIQNLKIKWKRELIKGETTSSFDIVSQILDGEYVDVVDEVESITEEKQRKSKLIRVRELCKEKMKYL